MSFLPCQIKEKLGEEIQSANAEFSDLQTTLITEKENKKIENEKTEERKPLKVYFQTEMTEPYVATGLPFIAPHLKLK